MRLSPLLAIALLAGCVAPAETVDPAAADEPDETAFVPWRSEGQQFVKPATTERTKIEVPFLVNGTGRLTTAGVTIGERYGPVELPRSTAYLEAQIVGPDGKVVASKQRMPLGEPSMKLEAKDLPTGASELVLLVGGGSDERANGDYVKWVIEVA